MANGEPLPDEIVLTREEARTVLFAVDGGLESTPPGSETRRELEVAAQIIVEKFLPDLRDL